MAPHVVALRVGAHMSNTIAAPLAPNLPASGYVREAGLVGTRPVTQKQARASRKPGSTKPRRERAGQAGFLPFSRETLWRKVRSGEFPQPVKLSVRVTAWRVEDVLAWLASKGR